MSEPWRPPAEEDGKLPPCVRVVDPPLRVWVDVRQWMAKGPHDDYSPDPTGLVLDYELLGTLTEKIWRADGGWLGRVQDLVLHTHDEKWQLGPWTSLVPGHLLRYHRRGRRGTAAHGHGH